MRAYLAAVLAWTLAAAVVFLPLGGPGVQPARAASGTTVEGPARFDPGTGTDGPRGTVTVSQVNDLRNQVVHVSWTDLTPTVDFMNQPVPIIAPLAPGVYYAVRIYQCRGDKPQVTDCYGSTLYGGDPAKGFLQQRPEAGSAPEFASNMVIAATRPDGTGEADIELWTSAQSQTLGCDATHKCSLVIEPNYGGDSLGANAYPDVVINCDDHTRDIDFDIDTASDASFLQTTRGNQAGFPAGESCAWQRHVTVPLEFAPTPDSCTAGDSDFSAIGLEMADRAMQQWRTGSCLESDPLRVQYSVGNGEPQARSAFLRRSGADVALTSIPSSDPPTRPYVYAPLANTAVSVVFVIDDSSTHRQVRRVRLNQRLLAKMLTQTYRHYNADDTDTVRGNPLCMFDDEEFRKLNADVAPDVTWPACGNVANTEPVVVGGTTDLVHRLTEWIVADPDAAQFLQGAADPWGTRINTKFLPSSFPGYPVDSFQTLDYSGLNNHKQYEWNPVLGGLGQVLRMVLENRLSCQLPYVNADGQHDKCFAMAPGSRALFAVMDSGGAQAMNLPEAELPNGAGAFTTPTITAMRAAAQDMPFDEATGTQRLPYDDGNSAYAKDPKAYPLTMVQYAMVPTEGLGGAKAAAVSRFVSSVTDPGKGQVYGRGPGQLAVGYADLTKAQVSQAKSAADHVAAQDSAQPGKAPGTEVDGGGSGGSTGGGSGSTGGTGGSGGSGGTGGTGPYGDGGSGSTGGDTGGAGAAGATAQSAAASGPPGSSASPGLAAARSAAADRAGMARLLLPVILATGAVLLVGGPAALFLGGTTAGANLRRGTGRLWSRLTRRG
ncbi:hypothetical protein HUT16_04175 [Kitasatospora sp. NA04385]|uniref:hypothetical protein n=1 Tax=Kitasatospora sp. NA04385 TaxID=2742135 RepID=UPI001591C2B7|nr:hypothetical protein [Kitasatospora sp. NA04385]QKW18367.1 hypothetical protein HUT16_04175 [Kitasatospora sp. NA04385]